MDLFTQKMEEFETCVLPVLPQITYAMLHTTHIIIYTTHIIIYIYIPHNYIYHPHNSVDLPRIGWSVKQARKNSFESNELLRIASVKHITTRLPEIGIHRKDFFFYFPY